VLISLGVTYSTLGEQQDALENFNRALPLVQREESRTPLASSLNGIGAAHTFLGGRQKAVDYFNKALAVFRVLLRERLQHWDSWYIVVDTVLPGVGQPLLEYQCMLER
jgi:tetratricopeptide (TPR) repeat protein